MKLFQGKLFSSFARKVLAAALVAAALSAEGESIIGGVHHIDRGYEHMEDALCTLGAEIKRRACV